jgi:hypothetical protein
MIFFYYVKVDILIYMKQTFYKYKKFAVKLNFNFKKNKVLAYLNLNGNKIGNKGGASIAEMLQSNFSLHVLDIGHTDLVYFIKIFLNLLVKYSKPNIYLNFKIKENRMFNCFCYNTERK